MASPFTGPTTKLSFLTLSISFPTPQVSEDNDLIIEDDTEAGSSVGNGSGGSGNGAPESAIKPLALYFDGVQYSKRDSFIGFYFHDMKKNLRHLSFVVRAPLRRLRGFKHHVRLRSFVRLGPPPQLIAYVSLVVPGMNTVRKLHC